MAIVSIKKIQRVSPGGRHPSITTFYVFVIVIPVRRSPFWLLFLFPIPTLFLPSLFAIATALPACIGNPSSHCTNNNGKISYAKPTEATTTGDASSRSKHSHHSSCIGHFDFLQTWLMAELLGGRRSSIASIANSLSYPREAYCSIRVFSVHPCVVNTKK